MNDMWKCPHCESELALEGLERVELTEVKMGQPRYLDVTYLCVCSNDLRQLRARYSSGPLRLLFGTVPRLPWSKTMRPTLSPEEIEREVAHARFELDCIHDVDEFLWWVDAYSTFRESPSSDS